MTATKRGGPPTGEHPAPSAAAAPAGPAAPGAAEPLASGLKLFREDFEQHIRDKRCRYRNGKSITW